MPPTFHSSRQTTGQGSWGVPGDPRRREAVRARGRAAPELAFTPSVAAMNHHHHKTLRDRVRPFEAFAGHRMKVAEAAREVDDHAIVADVRARLVGERHDRPALGHLDEQRIPRVVAVGRLPAFAAVVRHGYAMPGIAAGSHVYRRNDADRPKHPTRAAMKIVIPGGSGQVGGILVRARREHGDEVVVLSRGDAAGALRA